MRGKSRRVLGPVYWWSLAIVLAVAVLADKRNDCRLRRERGEPLSYALNHVLPEYASQVDAALLRRYPMLKILRDVLGVKLSHVQMSIEAQRATQEIGGALGVDVMSPVLFFTGVVFDQRQRVVDVAWIYYRADRFTFTLDLDVSR